MEDLKYKPEPDDAITTEAATEAYGVVALLDALGTRTRSLPESMSFLRQKDELIRSLRTTHKIYSTIKFLSNRDPFQWKLRTFGDTLLMMAEIERGKEVEALLEAAHYINSMIYEGMDNGLLFRGAMACGDYAYDQYNVVGPALSEAADYYDRFDWVGAVLSPRTGFLISEFAEVRTPELLTALDLNLYMYDVPTREASRVVSDLRLWCVNWPMSIIQQFLGSSADSRSIVKVARAALLRCLSTYSFPPTAFSKYDNALVYFDTVVKDETCLNAMLTTIRSAQEKHKSNRDADSN